MDALLAHLFTLGMLVLLQAVLGFDNLLYISLESKRVPAERQAYVRRLGIGLAIGLRIVLLIVLVKAIDALKEYELVHISWKDVLEGGFNFHSVIVLLGGIFILYTAVKEILHLLAVDELGEHGEKKVHSVRAAVFWIVAMNLVFSFDSILSAMALTDNITVMAIAIIASGLLMIWLSDHVAEFLKKNRMYEVLGLFILLIVGIMLISEGGHLAHLTLFGHKVEPMAKSTFYFVIGILVVVDLIQTRYQQKLLARRAAEKATA